VISVISTIQEEVSATLTARDSADTCSPISTATSYNPIERRGEQICFTVFDLYLCIFDAIIDVLNIQVFPVTFRFGADFLGIHVGSPCAGKVGIACAFECIKSLLRVDQFKVCRGKLRFSLIGIGKPSKHITFPNRVIDLDVDLFNNTGRLERKVGSVNRFEMSLCDHING